MVDGGQFRAGGHLRFSGRFFSHLIGSSVATAVCVLLVYFIGSVASAFLTATTHVTRDREEDLRLTRTGEPILPS